MTALISVVVLLVDSLTLPTSARCPSGWWLPLGAHHVYRCEPVPAERWTIGAHGGAVDASPPSSLWLIGRVYCDAPSTNDGVTIRCK